jgi:hypothetical protein
MSADSKVTRITRDHTFTSDRSWAQDDQLSYKARGIMAYVMSKPPDWTVWKSNLVNESQTDGEYAVATGIQSLIDAGYGKYARIQNADTGKFEGMILLLRESLDLEWPGTPIFRAPDNPVSGKTGPRKIGGHKGTEGLQEEKTDTGTENDNIAPAQARDAGGGDQEIPEDSDADRTLVEALTAYGISQPSAYELVGNHDWGDIFPQLLHYEWLLDQGGSRAPDSPGWIVSAVKQQYDLPREVRRQLSDRMSR